MDKEGTYQECEDALTMLEAAATAIQLGRPSGSKDRNNWVLGPKYYGLNGIWDLKPSYQGPWILRKAYELGDGNWRLTDLAGHLVPQCWEVSKHTGKGCRVPL